MSKLLYTIICCSVFYFTDTTHAMRPRSGSIEIDSKIQETVCSSMDIKTVFEQSYVNFENPELYIFVFNVGQGNFCLMRRNNKIAIVDAGKGKRLDAHINITKEFLNPFFANSVVETVFITHPHIDHFNLFSPLLLAKYKDAFTNTRFWLGGTQEDWEESARRLELVDKIRSEATREIKYMNREHKSLIVPFLDAVNFHILETMPPIELKKGEENKLSLIIQVSFNGKNIIFLGDSEGESVDRLK